MVDDHSLRYANLARYFGADSETHHAIVRSLSRLPQEVREFAVDRCVFFSLGGALHGQCMPTRFVTDAEWVILVDDNAPDLETIVAHEVAHAYRGDRFDDGLGDVETGRLTRELTRSWGFSGVGAAP